MEFYRAHILNDILINQNKEATKLIDGIALAMQNFFTVPSLDVARRFRRCNELGQQLTSVYTLMPNIEMTSNEFERTISKMQTIDADKEDKFFNSLTAMLEYRLPKTEEVVFTKAVNEMLHQDVAEIRAQVNNQILLIAAISTFAAVILAALF